MTKSSKIRFRYPGLFTLLFILFSGISCIKEDNVDLFIDSSLQEYFDRFAVEGGLRGFVIDYEALRISGYIRLITTPNVIGECAHNQEKPNEVIIDRTYWLAGNDLEREFLVFHELGHCALNREHLDIADNQGNCISIMTSGTGACTINYTLATRTALLDELFMP